MAFNRRKFLRYSLAAGCVGLGGYVWQVEPQWIVYEKQSLPIPDLSANLVGKTLVQISDLHIGHQVANGYLNRQFEHVQSLEPDFVVYTGDFVDHAEEFHFNKLKKLSAALPHGSQGTAGVLGNHDFVQGSNDISFAQKIEDHLTGSGVQILRDKSIRLGELTIAGLEDFWSPRFSRQRSNDVINSLPPASVVLSHNPDTADLPIWSGFKSWILSGHTHGGQCRIPGFTPPFLPVSNRNYVAGKYEIAGGHRMYINRGVGYTMKVRFCVRPEITVFTLANLQT